MKKNLLVLACTLIVFAIILTSCGGGDSNITTVGGLKIIGTTYSKDYTDEGPVDLTDQFYPTDTVFLSVEIKGRPDTGTISAEAYWKDQFIDSVDVDLASVNSDVIISIGENTYVYVSLTPSNPWPISSHYKFMVSVNDERLGEFPFTVIPPADAIPSVVNSVTLAKDVDANFNAIDPTTVFQAADPVVLIAKGDFGRDTWFNVQWNIAGTETSDCDTVIKADKDYPDDGLFFSCAPETGWPDGDHNVTFFMNDELVGTYSFHIE
ncbi:MAG: hypothetical protein GYA18_10580 [Chloroflexi bacterium]|nr:hypothetical protein [Chloroflexota bacterium]